MKKNFKNLTFWVFKIERFREQESNEWFFVKRIEIFFMVSKRFYIFITILYHLYRICRFFVKFMYNFKLHGVKKNIPYYFCQPGILSFYKKLL